MKKLKAAIVILALSGLCFAAPAPSNSEASAKKSKHEKKEQKEECIEKVKDLKALLDQQQATLQQMQQQLQQTQQQLQQTQQQLGMTQQTANQAEAKAASVDATNEQVQKVQEDLSQVKTTVNIASKEAMDANKKAEELEHPAALHYKGITLTPGGFLAAETLWRQHAENADIGSYYSGSHFPITADANTPDYHLTEWRGTARQSRITLLAQGKAGAAKLAGYYEIDFLGGAPTANENQSNSWQPRIRQLFGQTSMNGWTLTAGQTWSLITLNKKGIEARGEWSPATIDAQYIVGYTWARQMGARLTKTFNNNQETVAFSVENPATLIAGTSAPSGTLTGGTGAGQLGNGNTYTTNLAPDLIAKVAFDPGYGHYEIKAVGRFFRDRVGQVSSTTGANYTNFGGGFGAAAILPIVPRKVDFIVQGMAGRGIGRYGDSANTANGDVTYRPNGSLSPLQNVQVAAGIEAMVTPKLQMYFYGGEEYLGRDTYAGGTIGYGVPSVNVAGCFASAAVPASTTCSPITKDMIQGSAGFWYNFYKGGYGMLRYGMQYSYTYNSYWLGTVAPGVFEAPKANLNMAFTSLRYYIP